MACNLALRFIYSAVSAAMGCLFGCFRVRSDNRCPPRTHLVSEPAVSRSRTNVTSPNQFTSLLVSEEHDQSPCTDGPNQSSRFQQTEITDRDLQDEVSEASSSQAALLPPLYPLPPVKFHSEVSSSMANRILTLRCTDGSMFEVDEEIAKQSKLLTNMLEDGCATDTIPIENVTGTIMTEVLKYCKKHTDYNKRVSGREVGEDDDEYIDIENFDFDMFGFESISLLKQYLVAAHFLDIPDLEDKLTKTIARDIENMTVEQVREIFGIQNDFTPEEELKLKEEYDKAFGRPKKVFTDDDFPDVHRHIRLPFP